MNSDTISSFNQLGLQDSLLKVLDEVGYETPSAILAKEIGEYNFELGKKHFSYDVLEEKLTELFSF